MKILVVDDDAGIRSSIRRTLVREFNADVSEAADGFVALERLMKSSFDLVLLDIHMPEMDGIRTLQVIRRSPSRNAIPVVMLTGSADQAQVQEAQRLEVAGYLLKPIQPQTLVLRLTEILARCAKATTAPAPQRDLLTLRKQDRVLLVETELPFLEVALGQLSGYCHVDLATTAARALQGCLDAPPAAIFLGGPEDFAANALFVANVRNHARVSAVPIYALVTPDRMELTEVHVGVDGVLPRTLDEALWTASAQAVLRKAPEPEKYLEKALNATREYIASRTTGEVATVSGLSSRWLQRWLSARIDFDGPDVGWSLWLITADTSAARLVRAEPAAGAPAISEANCVSALTALASAAFEPIRRDGTVCQDPVPQCEVQTCAGSPVMEDGVVSSDKWVLALQNEILVLVRISERPKGVHPQARDLLRPITVHARR